MPKKILISAVVALTVTNLSISAFAQSNVKVALLDMSAMGIGTVGMMGSGVGMTGQSKMVPGMMSPGALRFDQDAVKAGDVIFDVTNWSRSTVHEMVIIAVNSPSSKLPYDYSQSEVREDQVKVVGDTSELKPNESKTVQLHLEPGTYMLICNVPGHYALGMASTLVVSQ